MYRSEREQALAKTALALMGERDVVPTPENFELFYAYAAGENPAIAQMVGAMIAAKTPFTADVLTDLRLRCLSDARAARAMEGVGSGIARTIDGVLEVLEAAGRHTEDYSNALSAASSELVAQQSPAEMRKLVDSLLAATQAMEDRARSLEGELQRSCDEVCELRNELDDVRKEALTDPLTCIANRKAFDAALESAMQKAAEGEALSLMLCDIDHFKDFNDNWGHHTGDRVLRLVAGCLSDNVKGRDMAARYGGEEFAVLLRGTGLADATRVADQMRRAIEGRKLVRKSTGNVLGIITISIGVAQYRPGETAETVMRRVDACLYGAKRHGRNLVLNQNDPRVARSDSAA